MIKNNNCHRWLLTGLFLIGLTVCSSHLYDSYNLLRTLVILISFVVLILSYYQKKLQFNLLALMIFLLFVYETFSILWGFSLSNGLKYSYLTLISLLVVLVFSQRRYEENLLYVYIINTLLIGINFVFVLITIVNEGWTPYGLHGSAANKNLLASLLILSLPIHIVALKVYSAKHIRIISFIVLVISLQFIIIIQSRSAYLALFFFLIAGVFFLIRYKRITPGFSIKTISRNYYIIPVSIIIGSFLYYISIDQKTREDYIDKINITNYFGKADPNKITDITYNNYESIENRKILWKNTGRLILDNFVCGIGKGNWSIAIGKHATASLPNQIINNKTFSHAHNDFLQQFAETGVIGFLLLIFPIFSILIIGCRAAFLTKFSLELVVFIIGLSAFLIILLFDFPLQQVEHRFLFYSELLILYQILEKKGEIRSRKIISIHTGIVILFCLFFIGTVIIQVRSDFYALRSIQFEAKGNNNAALNDLRKINDRLYDITPVNFPISYITGKILMNKGNLHEALPYIEKSLQINPFEPRILNDYGLLLSSERKYMESLAIFNAASTLAPYLEDIVFNIVATHFFLGNYQEAIEAINKLDDSPRKRSYLNQIFLEIEKQKQLQVLSPD